MANNNFQLNYDELTSIAKLFKDEGEDLLRLHSQTRQKVRDMHKDWIGEAADKFFDEMETVLLPALQRLSQALFLSQDTASEIMKIIREADEDTAGFFKNDLSDDFGAGAFGSIAGNMPGGQSQPGGLPTDPGGGGSPSAPEDFGAGKFGEVVGGGSPGGADDFGAGKFEDSVPPQDNQSSGGQGDDSSDGSSKSEDSDKGGGSETESQPGGGGGGGESASESQGLQGDLKNMNVGGSNQGQQSASAGGGGGAMQDHIFSDEGGGSASPKPEDLPAAGGQAKPGAGSGESQGSGGAAGAAAGAAGVAGAAGAAAKAVKGKKKNN